MMHRKFLEGHQISGSLKIVCLVWCGVFEDLCRMMSWLLSGLSRDPGRSGVANDDVNEKQS